MAILCSIASSPLRRSTRRRSSIRRNHCCARSKKHGWDVCKIFRDTTSYSSEDQYANYQHSQGCCESSRLRYYAQTTRYNRVGVDSISESQFFQFVFPASLLLAQVADAEFLHQSVLQLLVLLRKTGLLEARDVVLRQGPLFFHS